MGSVLGGAGGKVSVADRVTTKSQNITCQMHPASISSNLVEAIVTVVVARVLPGVTKHDMSNAPITCRSTSSSTCSTGSTTSSINFSRSKTR